MMKAVALVVYLQSVVLSGFRVSGSSFVQIERNAKVVPTDDSTALDGVSTISKVDNQEVRNETDNSSKDIATVEDETASSDKRRVSDIWSPQDRNASRKTSITASGKTSSSKTSSKNSSKGSRKGSRIPSFKDKMLRQKLDTVVRAEKKAHGVVLACTFGIGFPIFWLCTIVYWFANNAFLLILAVLFAGLSVIGIGENDTIMVRVFNVVSTMYYLWHSVQSGLIVYNNIYDLIQNEESDNACGRTLPHVGCVMNTVSWSLGFVFNVGAVLFTGSLAIRTHGTWKIAATKALEKCWFGTRIWSLFTGLNFIGYGLVFLALPSKYYPQNENYTTFFLASQIPAGLVTMSWYFIFTKKNRLRMAGLVRCLVTAEQTRAAASVAAMLGNVSPEEGFAMGRAKFHAISFENLPDNVFKNHNENEGEENTLYEKTSVMKLGTCDAFISHSWHDNSEKKFRVLRRWCQDFEKANGRKPMLWLDKACINQKCIASDLLCLPVFLAGCETLLIIAGPTYTERLWCIMEVFVFLTMGGSTDRIKVIAIDMENEQQAHNILEKADINKCKCHKEEDRDKLLSIVETGFGTFESFNKSIRNVFHKRLTSYRNSELSSRQSIQDTKPDSRYLVTEDQFRKALQKNISDKGQTEQQGNQDMAGR